MIEDIKQRVSKLLESDQSGHNMDHVLRVFEISLKFAKEENANEEVVSLAALLHDVDDYKLFGKDHEENLYNAKAIMNEVNVDQKTRKQVLDIIKNMGFSKALKGIRPTSLEGKIVSDADMCDAMGAGGIIRSVMYAVSDKGSGRIFERDVFPIENITHEEYNSLDTTHETDGAINHIFEKQLRLKNMTLTKSGKKEALIRHEFMILFLRQYFDEENVPEWNDFLDDYLSRLEGF